jgi:hypothetical protein
LCPEREAAIRRPTREGVPDGHGIQDRDELA